MPISTSYTASSHKRKHVNFDHVLQHKAEAKKEDTEVQRKDQDTQIRRRTHKGPPVDPGIDHVCHPIWSKPLSLSYVPHVCDTGVRISPKFAIDKTTRQAPAEREYLYTTKLANRKNKLIIHENWSSF